MGWAGTEIYGMGGTPLMGASGRGAPRRRNTVSSSNLAMRGSVLVQIFKFELRTRMSDATFNAVNGAAPPMGYLCVFPEWEPR